MPQQPDPDPDPDPRKNTITIISSFVGIWPLKLPLPLINLMSCEFVLWLFTSSHFVRH